MFVHSPSTSKLGNSLLAAAAAVALLAGCAAQEARDTIATGTTRAEKLVDGGPGVRERRRQNIIDRPHFSSEATRSRFGRPFPPPWESPGVRIEQSSKYSLDEARRALENVLRVPVVLALDMPAQSGMPARPSAPAPRVAAPAPTGDGEGDPFATMVQSANAGIPGLGGAPALFPAAVGPGSRGGDRSGNGPLIQWPRSVMPLSERLEFLDSTFGVRSSYDGQRIVIRRYLTRTYDIAFMSGTESRKMGLGGGEDGGQDGGGNGGESEVSASQKLEFDYNVNRWGDLEAGIRSLVPGDAVVTPLPSANKVIVVATPPAQEAVTAFIDDFNGSLTRQLNVVIEIVRISRTEGDDYGLDLDLQYSDLARGFDLGLLGPATGLLNNVGRLSGQITSGKWAGSSAAVQALTTDLRNQLVYKRSLIVKNNGTALMRGVLEEEYAASQQGRTVTETGVVSAGIETKTAFSGLALQISAQLLPNGAINLRYQPDLRGRPIFTPFTSGQGDSAQSVQLRRQTKDANMHELTAQNGRTIVAFSTTVDDSTTDDAGVGHARNPIFGGRISGGTQKDLLVVLMTPIEIDPNGLPKLDNN